jgi:timeless
MIFYLPYFVRELSFAHPNLRSLSVLQYNTIRHQHDCFAEAIRDLIKFLRRDGDDHEIRRFLGAANIVETDLLPILVEYSDKSELFDLVIRLLVNLTTPALLIYNEQPPMEKTPRQYYLQMLLHLQKYKRAFTDVNVWKVIVDKLAAVIQAVSNHN